MIDHSKVIRFYKDCDGFNRRVLMLQYPSHFDHKMRKHFKTERTLNGQKY